MLLFLAFGSTSLASFILDSAIFCDIYNISLGMIAFSTPFFSSVMCIDTQHINVHPNIRRLLMNVEDTYKAALAPHQIVNIGNKNYTILPNMYSNTFLPQLLLSAQHSLLFKLHYINLTYIQSIDK
jgi:hypothetical protein